MSLGVLAEPRQRMDGIRALGLEMISGSMPTFYSPHARARAEHLQSLLGGEIEYYSKQFRLPLHPVTMAVLNVEQWPSVVGDEPYGMPSVGDTRTPVFVMPTSWDEVTWMVVPKREEVPAVMLRKALANGKTWDQIKFEGCDGIGTHEIGHSVIHQLGIDPQAKWFNEFLASYAGYAYLEAKAPEEALANEIFWSVGLKHSPHRFTKLNDFENKYDELQQRYPGNYGWYQLALDQRVIEIYEQSGVEYLRKIRKRFPVGRAVLSQVELLNELEEISPGWKAWALRLEAGNVTAVRLKTPAPE